MPETPLITEHRVSTDVAFQEREPLSHLYSMCFGNGDIGVFHSSIFQGKRWLF